MASLLVEPLVDAAISCSIFALEQGIQLFSTVTVEKKDHIKKKGVELINNIFLSKNDEMIGSNDARFINLKKASENCLKQIQHLSSVFESSEFEASLDWLTDAWRALNGNDMVLFKKWIGKSYETARSARTKITTKPNHLLGVYSVIIFCGFCVFSQFGENILLGLQHIKDTLNECNTKSLLINILNQTVKSNIYIKKTQKIYIQNLILFGIRVRILVENFINYAQSNKIIVAATNDNDNDDDDDDNKQFGDVIHKLFPNATFNQMSNTDQLLQYKEWCPNPIIGRYFGGDADKIFKKMDFFKRIYPIMFDDKPVSSLLQFIEVYNEELAEYLSTSKDIADYMKHCIIKTDKDEYNLIKSDTKKPKQIALCLALHQEINKLANDHVDIDDNDLKNNDDDNDDNDMIIALNIPNKLVINSYNDLYDIIFISPFCGFNVIHFDGCDEKCIYKICSLLQNVRHKDKALDSVHEICIKNTNISLLCLNAAFQVFGNVCVQLKILKLESLTVEYNYYEIDKGGDTLNMDLIPSTVELFYYNNIKCVESTQINDKYDQDIINQLIQLNIGNKAQIIDAMNHIKDNTNVDQINKYIYDHRDEKKYKNSAYRFVCDNINDNDDDIDDDNDDNKSQNNEINYKSLSTIDFSSTLMNEDNLREIFCDFIAIQCIKATKIVLLNCGLNNNSCRIFLDFYKENSNHKLFELQLYNDKNNNLNENVITTQAFDQLTSMMKNTLQHRKQIIFKVDTGFEQSQIISTLGNVQWVPMDNI